MDDGGGSVLGNLVVERTPKRAGGLQSPHQLGLSPSLALVENRPCCARTVFRVTPKFSASLRPRCQSLRERDPQSTESLQQTHEVGLSPHVGFVKSRAQLGAHRVPGHTEGVCCVR